MAVKLRERKPCEWWIVVDHRGKRFSKKIGGDKRQAAQVAREVERKLAQGDLGLLRSEEPAVPTLAEYADRYLRAIVHGVKYTTHRDYEASFRLRILPALGEKRVNEITRADVKGLALQLREQGKSARNTRKTIAALSGLLSEAVDDGFLENNPALGLRGLFRSPDFKEGDSHRRANPLTREELAHLIATARTHSITRGGDTVYPYRHAVPFLLLLARTGLRLGEAVALQWQDVDFHGRFLEVRRACVRGRVTTPKNKSTRRVDLSAQLVETLRELHGTSFDGVAAISTAGQAELETGRVRLQESWIFSDGEKPLDGDNLRKRVFEPLLVAAGLRRVRLHDLRHTYASLLISAGRELHYIQEQLGHHSPAFTLSVYGHLLPRNRRGEVDCLDDSPAQIRNPAATGYSSNLDGQKESPVSA